MDPQHWSRAGCLAEEGSWSCFEQGPVPGELGGPVQPVQFDSLRWRLGWHFQDIYRSGYTFWSVLRSIFSRLPVVTVVLLVPKGDAGPMQKLELPGCSLTQHAYAPQSSQVLQFVSRSLDLPCKIARSC